MSVIDIIIEGSLEVKLRQYGQMKSIDGKSQRREEKRRGKEKRLAKAAGAETSDQMRDEKLHAVVARSTLRGQNVQSTPGSEHFWKLRC